VGGLALLAATGAGGPDTAALVTVVVATLSLFGTLTVGVYTARSSRATARESASLEADKVDAMRVDSLLRELEQVRKDRAEDRAEAARQRDADRAQHAEEIEQWRRRVLQLDKRYQNTAEQLDELSRWARVIRRVLGEPAVSAAILAEAIQVPPTPRGFGLMDTDPGWRRARLPPDDDEG
jgi:hypothetical protein